MGAWKFDPSCICVSDHDTIHDQQLWYMINRLSWQWLMFIVHDRQSFIPMINSCDEWSTVFHGNDQYLSYMINSLCICVFSCQTLRNIIFEVLASFPFQKYNTCLVKFQILPKLYLCICVFVFMYLVTPHSYKTNIKKMPVPTLQFFRWAALL